MIRLSEAIILGCSMVKKCEKEFITTDFKGACTIGTAAIALGYKELGGSPSFIREQYPWLKKKVYEFPEALKLCRKLRPRIYSQYDIMDFISSLNFDYSREEIAGWVAKWEERYNVYEDARLDRIERRPLLKRCKDVVGLVLVGCFGWLIR